MVSSLEFYVNNNRIPRAVIERLPLYLRYLTKLQKDGVDIISSQELGEKMGLRPSQIRKDLTFFGEFGVRGMGYDTGVLLSIVKELLGLEKGWNMAFLGAGELAVALSQYEGLKKYGFRVVAFFDDDPEKIGRRINGIRIRELRSISEVAKSLDLKIGAITLPALKAQEGADLLIEAGIKGIWNFTPAKIVVPADVEVYNEDLTLGPLSLSYFLSRKIS